jgi:PKD repeat protein
MNIKLCLLAILTFFIFSSLLWADLQIVPPNHDFGTQPLNSESTQSFALSAVDGDVMIMSATWQTGVPAFYMLPAIEPFTVIYIGSTLNFSIGFMPTNPMTYSDVLILETGTAVYSIAVEGTGESADAPALIISPTEHDFGTTITLGETGIATFSVSRNPEFGGATATVDSAVLRGDPAFTLSLDVQSATGEPISLPYLLEGAGMAVFTVDFEPLTTDPQSAILSIYDAGGDSLNVNITAYSGAIMMGPIISVDPATVVLSMAANSVAGGILTVSNVGDGNLNYWVESTATEITLFPASGTIAAGDSSLVQYAVHSAALSPGYYSRSIVFESNDYGHSPLLIPFEITVNAQPQQVDFIGAPLSGHAPLQVQFTDMSFASGQGWRWDFNNDGIIDSYLQNPLHSYTSPGVYTVKLALIDGNGAYLERVKTNYVTVTNNPPIVLPGSFTEQEFMEDQAGGPFDLLECFSDPDGDPMSFSVTPSANIWGSATGDGMLMLYATSNWFGTEDITVHASDPFGGVASHTFSVTVLQVNDPPQLSVPEHLHFIRNSVFAVDFTQYISDADNELDELSISVQRIWGLGMIDFHYFPVDAPNTLGQFTVLFSSAMQTNHSENFRISVNDNTGRAITSADFTMHVLEHFDAQVGLEEDYQYTGQTVQFRDVTLGNPNCWQWNFGDGQTSTQRHPSHIYAQAGSYDVTLTLGHSGAGEEDTIFMPGFITMAGTAVTEQDIPSTWTQGGSPYNLFGDIVIAGDAEVNVEPHVEVNLFGTNPVLINGVFNASLAKFRAQNTNGRWGGFRFQGSNQREPSVISDCDIVDAILPIDIMDASPLITGVTITVSDTTVVEPSRGIRITGGSSPNLNDVELINYGKGILIQNEGSGYRVTPTLTNIRVRNSSQTSRVEPDSGTGLKVSGTAEINTLMVDNFGTAIEIDGTISNTTPTLTNIRVRNSSQTSRSERLGIRITGGASPSLEDVDIEDVSQGILIEGSGALQRTTPTLTNIRVRNSSQTSRAETWGLSVQDVASLELSDAEFEGFDTGILIRAISRVQSTPTLTNIRVRNSSQTSRVENIGIDIAGSVEAYLDDVVVEDYPFGIKYHGDVHSRATSTPTLTNIRVRNSSQTSRNLFIGMQLRDLDRVICTNDSIGGYQVGLEITNSGFFRATSTPTLTNIRVRNSSQTSRYGNAGIFLGAGVAGSLTGADVAGGRIGIFIADGNSTRLDPARIFNCETGIKAAGSLLPKPLKRHLVVLTPAFKTEHPDWQFKAFDISMPGPWLIHNNTIDGYPVYMKATNAGILFDSNIAWNESPTSQPFHLQDTLLNTSYNNINSIPLYLGTGNIALNPVFNNPAEEDYSLGHDSPCIDAGSPLLPRDADGSRADMGAFPYLHRASMTVSQRFIQPGTQVVFTNTSLGHDHPGSTCAWDLGKDGIIESQDRDWTYQFDNPGVYNLRLTMSSGLLQDVREYDAVVVVQSALLQAPQGLTIGLAETDIQLSWEPVTLTQQGDPISVEYYLVYSCDDPDDYFDFVGNSQDYGTSYTHVGGAEANRRFYFVLGFTGSLRELQQFIEHNPRMRLSAPEVRQMRSKP